MKQNFVFLTMLAILMSLIGCNDNSQQTVVAATKTSPVEHLRLYFASIHPSEQKRIFEKLPAITKHAIFISHWEAQMSSAKNQKERTFIRNLIDHLKPAYYQDSVLFMSQGAPWMHIQIGEGLKIFKNDSARLASILFELGGDRTQLAAQEDPNKKDCECSTKDDWCKVFKCMTSVCTIKEKACGGAWMYDCDGLCSW